MRKGYVIDTSTSVDIQKIVENGGKVIKVSEGVLHTKYYKIPQFRKKIEKLFALS